MAKIQKYTDKAWMGRSKGWRTVRGSTTYAIVNNRKPIAFLEMTTANRAVQYISTDPKHQKKGLATKLYLSALKDGPILSGALTSPGERLRKSLIRRKLVSFKSNGRDTDVGTVTLRKAGGSVRNKAKGKGTGGSSDG